MNADEMLRGMSCVFNDVEKDFFSKQFSIMGVAEEEIEVAMDVFPERKDKIWASFYMCKSVIVPNSAPLSVHRIHAKQLLRMVGTRQDLNVPTNVEVACMVILGLQHAAPPNLDLALFFLGDRETTMAFGIEPLDTYDKDVGREYLPDLIRAFAKVHIAMHGKTRAQLAMELFAKHEKVANRN